MIVVIDEHDAFCEEDREQHGSPDFAAAGGAIVDIGAREAAGIIVANEPVPSTESFRLEAPAPNPARASTELVIHLAEAESVRLDIYDVLGREVARLHDGLLAAGRHSFVLEEHRLSAGVYLVRATGPSFQATQPLTLVR